MLQQGGARTKGLGGDTIIIPTLKAPTSPYDTGSLTSRATDLRLKVITKLDTTPNTTVANCQG